ncbi:MAG: hypothetical protein HY611_00040 [Elusimicrobia bacterium]|nr:hypothetical protein [Elusimicrobiota bacterium]
MRRTSRKTVLTVLASAIWLGMAAVPLYAAILGRGAQAWKSHLTSLRAQPAVWGNSPLSKLGFNLFSDKNVGDFADLMADHHVANTLKASAALQAATGDETGYLKFLIKKEVGQLSDRIKAGRMEAEDFSKLNGALAVASLDSELKGQVQSLLQKASQQKTAGAFQQISSEFDGSARKPELQDVKGSPNPESKKSIQDFMESLTGPAPVKLPGRAPQNATQFKRVLWSLRAGELDRYAIRDSAHGYKIKSVYTIPENFRGKTSMALYEPTSPYLPEYVEVEVEQDGNRFFYKFSTGKAEELFAVRWVNADGSTGGQSGGAIESNLHTLAADWLNYWTGVVNAYLANPSDI